MILLTKLCWFAVLQDIYVHLPAGKSVLGKTVAEVFARTPYWGHSFSYIYRPGPP